MRKAIKTEMDNHILFLSNSVYQLIVACWMKYALFPDKKADIFISNHFNRADNLEENIQKTGLFENVKLIDTKKESRYQVQRKGLYRVQSNINPEIPLGEYVKLDYGYSDLYIANFDGFSQLLYSGLYHKNDKLRLHVYEDGISTYMEFERYYRKFENYYYSSKESFFNAIRRRVYGVRNIYGNISGFHVFNPELMKWDPGCPIETIPKIDPGDREFVKLLLSVFDVKQSDDRYDEKYIFLEESFYADGEAISDTELVEELADRVGKENIMVKIHPRNPVNRFRQLGYKTNRDTGIPWEVILLNMENAEEHVLVTIASSAILNPIMIFGIKTHAYSLFPLLREIPKRLNGKSWEFIKELYSKYPEMITICDDIRMID